jgi:methionine sulfoxide reductase heme-binding subunit
MISARLQRRLWRHHFPLALVTSTSGFLLYVTRPYPDVITRLSFASAYPALILLAATLVIGPWNVVMGKRPPASLDLRRDIGIWAGMSGVFHAVVGQCVHLRGRPWLYYVYENWQQKHWQPFRHDLFGLANYTGLIASLVLLALLATSNDASLRKLGTPGWKKLQRWNYYCFGLSAVHTFTYQVGVGSQTAPFLIAAIVAALLTIILQYAGYRQRRA